MRIGQPGQLQKNLSGFGTPYDLLRALLSELGPDHLPTGGQIEQIAAGLEIRDDAFWNELVGQLDYHGLTLLIEPLIGALKARPGALPAGARRAFFALAARHRQLATVREAAIDRLIEAFASAGIEMVLLKGAVLAHRIYPAPELRPMIDIDILIDPAQSQAAVMVASKLGYLFESRHPSKFSGLQHHIPVAEIIQSGFRIFLEIHIEAMHLDQPHRLGLANLTSPPQPFARGSGPAGLALGHTDMLRHLAAHAFGQAQWIRLIHLYDLWRYQAIFRDQIDWQQMQERFPHVIVVLSLVSQVFQRLGPTGLPETTAKPVPAGLGKGMIPLAVIASSDMSLTRKMTAIFNPPAWWLHGFYGIPLERSLLACRTIRHPLMIARWLLARSTAVAGLSDNWNWVENYNKTHRIEP